MSVKAISLLMIILFMSGCKNGPSYLFEANLFLRWHAAFKLEIKGEEYLNSNKKVARPYNTWQPLFQVDLIDELAQNSFSECLLYRVPSNQQKGILRVVKLKKTERCGEAFSNSSGMDLGEIDALQIYYSDQKILVKEKKKTLMPYSIHMLIDRKGDQDWISIPLLNIKGARELTLFSSGVNKGYAKGIFYWPYSNKTIQLNQRKSPHKYIGSLFDRYIDQKLVVCEKVKDDCSLDGESRCDRCRYGWFEVVGTKCKSRRTKLCGPNTCGKKGEPACVRGNIYQGFSEKKMGCFGGSKAGFCESGLGTYCDGNGILICL